MSTPARRLDALLKTLPHTYPGPGGALAVLKDGQTIIRHAWGYANAERRIPFTPRTLFRMCSITKQFTCGLVLDAFANPSLLDEDVARRLPELREAPPSLLQLCHNQSGLRDYWAVAMLQGAPVESAFGEHEAAAVIGGTRSLQFAPGTRYSYVNQNFRLLSDILEDRLETGFADLLRQRIFERVGMEQAILAADTRAMPDGTEGYEGTPQLGFRAAENRIVWTGDAGLGASLDDMIAWERHIDGTRDDPTSLPRRLAAPVTFADGGPAAYGFGLVRSQELGWEVIGHGGALRGWRSQRLYMPAERLSVVVMFNHLANPQAAAMDVVRAVLDQPAHAPGPAPRPSWLGAYLDPETGLSARVAEGGPGRVVLRFGHSPELLDLEAGGARSTAGVRLRPEGGGLALARPAENLRTVLRPLEDGRRLDVAGRYHCAELDAELTITGAGGILYGGFSGRLGPGRMELLVHVGLDVWALPCPRALDHTPPGDWTLSFHRAADGTVSEVVVGCWLARGLRYLPMPA